MDSNKYSKDKTIIQSNTHIAAINNYWILSNDTIIYTFKSAFVNTWSAKQKDKIQQKMYKYSLFQG
jgi:hypothetical protein